MVMIILEKIDTDQSFCIKHFVGSFYQEHQSVQMQLL